MNSGPIRKTAIAARAAAVLAAVFLTCPGWAQTTSPTPAQDAATPPNSTVQAQSNSQAQRQDNTLAVGRVIYAELAQTIDVKKVKVGEPILAKATLAVLSHGKILIADGARISGHITQAKARSKKDPESLLGIVFDRAELPDGKELPLALTVQAVGIGSLSRSPGGLDDDGPLTGPPGFPDLSARHSNPGESSQLKPKVMTSPALDLGSKGVVGLDGLDLTEATDPAQGSLVKSTTKDVKLANRYELVLRVIPAKREKVSLK